MHFAVFICFCEGCLVLKYFKEHFKNDSNGKKKTCSCQIFLIFCKNFDLQLNSKVGLT